MYATYRPPVILAP